MKPEQSPARNQTSPPCYTAAQIAAALGWTKRHAWKRLAPIPSPGKKVVRGNEADAWAPETIPADMHAKLVASARAHGMSFQEWIEGCSKPWEPRLALSEIAEPCLQDAAKLRDALLPALEIMDAPAISPQTLIARGLESYKRPFGQPISERQWRRLFDRTLRRDAGAKQFGRLELYLPENPDRKAAAAPAQAPQWDFSDLKTTIETFHVAGAPNRAELAGLWSEAFALYSAEADTEESRRALRKALIQFLWQNVPAIAPSQNAARVYFDRKWDKWKKAGCSGKALLDGRELKRGLARARQVPQEDMDRIVWEAAVKCRGRVRPAVRNLVEIGALSPATLELLPDDSCSKSYLNARIARPAKQEVEMIRPYVLGKKAIDDVTASIERDYSGLRSMSVVTGDDFTLNNYFYVPDGAGWYNLVRGQCLMFMDCRSLRILARSLQPEPNYCGLVIRTLQNDLTRKWGLPDCWYFERGIWQRSKLVKNAAPVHWSAALSAAETEVGWEAIEVRFVHATRARSKPAELIGGMLQNLLDGLPGYCGRDERRDMPEATKKALEAVRGQREHPSKFFFSFDQWLVELDKAMDRYNATPQEGRILNGLSPDEAFIKFWPRGGPTPWSPACWHLMAHWVSERIVKEPRSPIPRPVRCNTSQPTRTGVLNSLGGSLRPVARGHLRIQATSGWATRGFKSNRLAWHVS